MRLSVRADGLAARMRDAVEAASAAGFGAIDLGIRGEFGPDGFPASARRDFRNSLARRGMGVGALHAELPRPLTDADANNASVPFIARCMELVRDVGGSVLVARLGRLGSEASRERASAAEAVSDLESACSRFGVMLAVEAEGDAAEAAEFAKGFSEVCVAAALDVASSVRRGADPSAEIAAMAGRLLQVTARDTRDGEAAEFGAGVVDWPAVVGALLAMDYAGILTVSPRGRLPDELTRARALLGAFG